MSLSQPFMMWRGKKKSLKGHSYLTKDKLHREGVSSIFNFSQVIHLPEGVCYESKIFGFLSIKRDGD